MQNYRTFAFQLASTQKTEQQWKVRDGVAVAGCTDPTNQGDYRESVDYNGWWRGRDKGYWC
jgi:hypothetical protein